MFWLMLNIFCANLFCFVTKTQGAICLFTALRSRRTISSVRAKKKMLGTKDISQIPVKNNNTDGSEYKGPKYTVSVEGNIGSGKTTLLDYFCKSKHVQAVKEPVDQWTNLKGHNALSLLYEDPERWSCTFNIYAQLTRAQMHMKPHTAPVKLLERSLFSTRYCFVENAYRNNVITDLEHNIITSWFDFLIGTQKINLDLIVYLRADPQTCYQRIKQRDRKEESSVPFELIESLHTLHEEWLIGEKHFRVPAPVLVINADCDYKDIVRCYEEKRRDILCGVDTAMLQI